MSLMHKCTKMKWLQVYSNSLREVHAVLSLHCCKFSVKSSFWNLPLGYFLRWEILKTCKTIIKMSCCDKKRLPVHAYIIN